MLKIKSVDKHSVGRELRLKSGYVITHFDGQKVEDVLDYEYFDGKESFSMTVNTPNGEIIYDVEKDSDETLGLNFEESCYLNDPLPCCNNCIFCFVAQMPRGMRKTLYVKDDDWKFSFISGTYVTLTNLKDGDIERIVRQKFSPIYVSVHCTDENMRRHMLGNPNAPDIMPILKRLADGGITIHTQIVVCAGYNDGKVLEKTLNDLYSLYPQVAGVAVVPVGLTKFRDKLTPLSPLTASQACDVIDISDAFNRRSQAEKGAVFAYCSDEMYLRANRPLPSYEFYGEFDQIENGVGLMAKYRREFEEALELAEKPRKGSFTLVTGVDAYGFMQEIVHYAKTKFPQLDAEVVKVTNHFFGETVTVAGLLTGQDVASQLEGRTLKDIVLLPRTTLKEFDTVFLDGMTLRDLKKKLKRKIICIGNAYELAETMFHGVKV